MEYSDFLQKAGIKEIQQIIELPKDASSRTYYRVYDKKGHSFILMDDSTKSNHSEEFVVISEFLLKNNIRAPKVLYTDLTAGFLLLEDLGENTFTKLLAPENEQNLYSLATELLIKSAKLNKEIENIPNLCQERIVNDISFFIDDYYPLVANKPLSQEKKAEFIKIVRELLPLGYGVGDSLVLWDYHIDNIMLPSDGNDCAVLDFQDALWGPLTYDLVSLLEDARREVSAEVIVNAKKTFFNHFSDIKEENLEDSYKFFSMFRHMRVLGRFAALYSKFGKDKYLKFIPHLWKMLEKTLDYPKLSSMKLWIEQNFAKELRIIPQQPLINKAFVLAAGRGSRMRELCDDLPKPLVKVCNKTLLDYNLDKLSKIGIKDIVVNVCYQGDKIVSHLKERTDFNIVISEEKEALETGGGIKKALNLLGKNPFIALNSDTFWSENGPKDALKLMTEAWDSNKYDILLLLNSIDKVEGFNNIGNYKISPKGRLIRNELKEEGFDLFFCGASILKPELFDNITKQSFSLRELFDNAMQKNRLGYVINNGTIYHVDSPEALKKVEKILKAEKSY